MLFHALLQTAAASINVFYDPQLYRLQDPLAVIDQKYIRKEQTNIIISRKVRLVRQYYELTNAVTGNMMFYIRSPIISSNKCRILEDTQHKPICNIWSKFKVFRNQSMYMIDKQDHLIGDFKQSTNMKNYLLEISVVNKFNNETQIVYLEGDTMLHEKARIFLKSKDNQFSLLATMRIKKTVKQVLFNRDYWLMIAPGVDIAFVAMLAASFDLSVLYKLAG